MARTLLTPVTAPGFRTGAGVLVPFAAADAVNGNRFRASGRDLVLARVAGAVDRTVTFRSVPRPRLGDAAATVARGQVAIDVPVGPTPVTAAGEGQKVPDFSGNGRHLEYSDGAVARQGNLLAADAGESTRLEVRGQHIRHTPATGLNLAGGNWTLSWVSNWQDNAADSIQMGFQFGGATGQVSVATFGAGNNFSMVLNDVWTYLGDNEGFGLHHYAFVGDFAGGQMRMYKDGVLMAPQGALGSAVTIEELRMGAAINPIQFFNLGYYQEVALFGRALTVSEIQAQAAARTAGGYPDAVLGTSGLYAYWRMTTLPAVPGEVRLFGPFPKAGWAQPDRSIYLDGSHADIELAVVRLGP